MDDSILAKFPGDDHVLGPFLGNLPPEILDVVVRNLGSCFRTTFAMAGRTCREAVERVPSTRAVLTEEERERIQSYYVLTEEERGRLQSPEITPLAVAAMEGDVEALEWLIQLFDGKDLEWRDVGKGLHCLAAGRGKLESLICLRANGCPWDKWTYAFAARESHLEVLQWGRQNGCPWDRRTCLAAAEGGHLEVLQWARRNGCPWGEETCSAAAGGGHLEVLQWAHQNGCPWDERTWTRAKSHCRRYLIEHRCPGAA